MGDEPFQRKCMKRIRQFQREGRTIVFVTHGLDTVRQLCDRVIMLDKGEVVVDGKPLRRRPRAFRERYQPRSSAKDDVRRTGESTSPPCGSPTTRAGQRAVRVGRRLGIELMLEATEPVDDPVVGVAIYNHLDSMVYGTNTGIRSSDARPAGPAPDPVRSSGPSPWSRASTSSRSPWIPPTSRSATTRSTTRRPSRCSAASTTSASSTWIPASSSTTESRIVVVSAHYPPNFVSGGTLQAAAPRPGLAARGHDVSRVRRLARRERPPSSVGRHRRHRPARPLDRHHAVDGLGRRPQLGQPRRGRRLPAYLPSPPRRRPPALPAVAGRGSGAAAARASGARVVVTMHDFWWFCARQFLVDRDLQPCSPGRRRRGVPVRGRPALARSAGTRACATSLEPPTSCWPRRPARPRCWRPTASTRARLAVDENGLPRRWPPTARRPRSTPPEGTLRFVYTGGRNPMKGVARPARRRRGAGGHAGLAAHRPRRRAVPARRRAARLAGLPVELVPPFDPAAADAVWRRRRARAAVGDAGVALARHPGGAAPAACPWSAPTPSARRRWSTTGATGSSCRPATPAPWPGPSRRWSTTRPARPAAAGGRGRRVRTLAISSTSQVAIGARSDCFDRADRAARARPRPPARPSRRSGACCSSCGIDGAPLRYRARLPAEAPGAASASRTDVRHYRDPDAGWPWRPGRRGRRLPGAGDRPGARADRRRSRATGMPVRLRRRRPHLRPRPGRRDPGPRCCRRTRPSCGCEGVRRYRTTMEACDAYIGSTEALLATPPRSPACPPTASTTASACCWPPLRPRAAPAPAGRAAPHRLLQRHDHPRPRLALVEPAVRRRSSTATPSVELWLGGHLPVTPALDALGDAGPARIPFLPWTSCPALLRDLDVNLAPLAPGSRVQRGQERHQVAGGGAGRDADGRHPTEPFREAIRPARPACSPQTPGNGSTPSTPCSTTPTCAGASGAGPAVRPCGRRPPTSRPAATRRSSRRGPAPGSATVALGTRRWRSTSRPFASPWSPTTQAGSFRPMAPAPRQGTAASSRSDGPLGPWVSRSDGPLGPWVYRSDGPLGPWAIVPRAGRLATKAWSSWRADGAAATAQRAAAFSRRQFDTRIRPRLGRSAG